MQTQAGVTSSVLVDMNFASTLRGLAVKWRQQNVPFLWITTLVIGWVCFPKVTNDWGWGYDWKCSVETDSTWGDRSLGACSFLPLDGHGPRFSTWHIWTWFLPPHREGFFCCCFLAVLSFPCYTWAFSSCKKWRLYSLVGGIQASHFSGFSCGARA